MSTMTFDGVWKSLAIPGEFDSMDELDRARWRGVVEDAFDAGRSLTACALGCQECVREMRTQISEQTRMVEQYMTDIMRDQAEIERLRASLTELRDRIKGHPAYADLTEALET